MPYEDGRAQRAGALKRSIFAASGCAMTPTHTRRGGRLYRYYVSADLLKDRGGDCPVRRVPAGEIEAAVLDQLRGLLRAPEIVVRTWRAAQALDDGIGEAEVRDALDRFDALWDELFPAEQARIVHLLLERVEVGGDGLTIRLRTEGLGTLVSDLRGQTGAERLAA